MKKLFTLFIAIMITTLTLAGCEGNIPMLPTDPGEGNNEHIHIQETIQSTDPTCTEAGNTVGTKCAECDEILTPTETVAPLGHSFVLVSDSADCEKDGMLRYECTSCDEY